MIWLKIFDEVVVELDTRAAVTKGLSENGGPPSKGAHSLSGRLVPWAALPPPISWFQCPQNTAAGFPQSE